MNNDSETERKKQFAQMIDEEVEGRLSAHRYILSHLLARLSSESEEQKLLLHWLSERATVNDSEEDPGSVIVQGYAEQQARADEFGMILEDVRRLIELDGQR